VFASSTVFLSFGLFALEASFDYATAFSCIDCVRTQIFVRTNFLPIQAYIPYFAPGVIALILSGAFLAIRDYKLMAMSICFFVFDAWIVFYSSFSPLWHEASNPTTLLYRYLEERPIFLETNSAGDLQAFYAFGIGMISLFVCLVLSDRKRVSAFNLTCLVSFCLLLAFEVGIFFILNSAWNSQVTLFQKGILPPYFSGITNQGVFAISTVGLSISITFLMLEHGLMSASTSRFGRK
jgi:hypothetical protein